MQEIYEEEIRYYDLQAQLVQAVVDGNLRVVKDLLGIKGFSETGKISTQVISKILNLPDDLLSENHFLILQMALSIHPNLDSTIVNAVCAWLIGIKDRLKLPYGQRILNVFMSRGFIGECQLENLHSTADLNIKTILAHAESLSCEMSLAIYTDNVIDFESSFVHLAAGYDIYREILIKCLEAQAYGIIALLLQQYPLSVKSVRNVQNCIALLKEHLFMDKHHAEAKILLLQYMAMSYALADKVGELRRYLIKLVDEMLVDAKIQAKREQNIQDRINLLINYIDPNYESQQDSKVEAPRQLSMHRLFDQGVLATTYLFNKFQTREGGQYNRRDFIDDNLMLGMMPGCKCGLAIISEFKQIKKKPLGLVVTCQKNAEIRWETLLYTPASPEYWRNMPGNIVQIQVSLQDFGFDSDPLEVIRALNKMYEYYVEKNLGIYIHCKAGKGRSVFVTALFYVLFREDLQCATPMETIKNVYNYIAKSRVQICNNEKSWNAVNNFLPIYLQSALCHPKVCFKLPEVQSSFLYDTDEEDYISSYNY